MKGITNLLVLAILALLLLFIKNSAPFVPCTYISDRVTC